MIKTGIENSVNESSKFNASSSVKDLRKHAAKLVETAKESANQKDAWAVVDFLHDFPNILE